MLIRKADVTESDLLTKLALESKAYWGYSIEFMKACTEELRVTCEKISSDSFEYFVAEDNKQILGFYAVEHLSHKLAELEALFVRPESIGCGIGKLLIQHAISHARENEFTSLRIIGDPNAENFYLNAGARLIGQEESGSIPDRILPVFVYDLIK